MNKQEVFNIVSVHLLRQGTRSLNGGACAYRGHDGTKCSIGSLIDDNHYDPKMEGMGIGALFRKFDLGFDADTAFLVDLQLIHDKFKPAAWKEKLTKLAQKRHLTLPLEFTQL